MKTVETKKTLQYYQHTLLFFFVVILLGSLAFRYMTSSAQSLTTSPKFISTQDS